MASHCNDLTVDQLLNDPMTQAVMRADGVDPVSFKAMLAGQAERLRDSRRLREAKGAGVPTFAAGGTFSISRAPAFKAAGSPYDSCRAL